MIENKKYFIDQINSSKANKMTAAFHYSGVGFKKAMVNLGVFRKEDSKLVGVMQWGCNFQEAIKLNRYVKEPIGKEEYLELNRFSMADSEGKNSESQAIGLGIKWIKQNMPHIRLLVSYAGRKEGNYGYIYQATNWEYLGYFISKGFWFVDGEERHVVTLWYRTKNSGKTLVEALKDMYEDVRETHTKQFIYIQRLDKTLTPASPVLPYPKPTNEFPIKTKEIIHKQNDEVFKGYKNKERVIPEYYHEEEKLLFSRQALIRRGVIEPKKHYKVAQYSLEGYLEDIYDNTKIAEEKSGYRIDGIRKSIRTEAMYKDKYFRPVDNVDDVPEEIDVFIICYIDEIPFASYAKAGEYLKVSRQAVHQAHARKAKSIGGKEIQWV